MTINVEKDMDITDIKGAKANITDLKVFGDGDLFKLICKASSKSQRWMKSTKAMEIKDIGCVIQVTTQQGDNVAEALTFVPDVCILEQSDGSRLLVSQAAREAYAAAGERKLYTE